MSSRGATAGVALSVAAVVAAFSVPLTPAVATARSRLTVQPASGPPTARVEVAGRGFRPGERVVVSFEELAVGSADVAGDGSFSIRIAVPRRAFPGRHRIEARGRSSGRRASASFLVRTDWYQEGFDAGHTSNNPYENVLAPDNVGRLVQAWAVPVGYSTVYASPIVVGGRVFLGDDRGRLHAFEAATGTELWSVHERWFFRGSAPASVAAHNFVFGQARDQAAYNRWRGK